MSLLSLTSMLVIAFAFFFFPRTWAFPYCVQLGFAVVRARRYRHVAQIVVKEDAIGADTV